MSTLNISSEVSCIIELKMTELWWSTELRAVSGLLYLPWCSLDNKVVVTLELIEGKKKKIKSCCSCCCMKCSAVWERCQPEQHMACRWHYQAALWQGMVLFWDTHNADAGLAQGISPERQQTPTDCIQFLDYQPQIFSVLQLFLGCL